MRVRVLCLVDQDVVDAAVELVQDPARPDPREQVEGLVDQVVEIEGAEAGLLGLDAAVNLGGEREQRPGAPLRARAPQDVEQPLQPVALGHERLADRLRNRLGAEAFGRFRLVLLGEEDGAVGLERPRRVARAPRGDGLRKPVGERLVGRFARAQGVDRALPIVEALENTGLDRLGALFRSEAERPRQSGELRRETLAVRQHGAGLDRRPDRLAERVARRLRRHDGVGGLQLRVAAHDRVGQHVVGLDREGLAGLVLVEDDEPGRHIRLEREHVQQPLAERVQGLDLEAPRRLDRAREEAAGRLQALARGPLAGEAGQLGREGLVVEGHPAAEALEDADRHVGGGRLGEGEAEDAPRRRPVEEEPHHPVGEDLGLAGPGIGRDPGRGARIRRPALSRLGQFVDDEDFAPRHQLSPSPPSDHSSTRARWS
ncbi:hypothetical protein AEGHOMDF_5551 [Methylobacterium soli]|nr:hypothetical protein AEGHOMDF_5551 [Methylobacterium soli]